MTVLFSWILLTFLYVADRNEGKLKGTDCINITSDPFEAKAKTNNTIHLIDTTMANNVFPTSMVNTGTCNLSLRIENYNPKWDNAISNWPPFVNWTSLETELHDMIKRPPCSKACTSVDTNSLHNHLGLTFLNLILWKMVCNIIMLVIPPKCHGLLKG